MSNTLEHPTNIISAPAAGASPLSVEMALDIFHQLANRWDLGWGYVRTACYPKAYLACEDALTRDLMPLKAWAFEAGKRLSGKHPSGGEYNWEHHVSLALPVILNNGHVENLVFDPALFNAPVSLQQWSATIGSTPERSAILDYQETPSKSLTGKDIAMTSVAHTPENTERAIIKVRAWSKQEPTGPRIVLRSDILGDAASCNTDRWLSIGWETLTDADMNATTPTRGKSVAPKRAELVLKT